MTLGGEEKGAWLHGALASNPPPRETSADPWLLERTTSVIGLLCGVLSGAAVAHPRILLAVCEATAALF